MRAPSLYGRRRWHRGHRVLVLGATFFGAGTGVLPHVVVVCTLVLLRFFYLRRARRRHVVIILKIGGLAYLPWQLAFGM
jgi:hypothetical protein